MTWEVTIGGVSSQQTFNQNSFSGGQGGNAYADETTGLPAALQRIVEHVRDAFKGSSSTSVTIGTGSYTLASTPNRPWVAGLPLQVVDAASSGNVMYGTVTSYDASAGTLVFASTGSAGSGTPASLLIYISGTGPAGPSGPAFTGGALSSTTYMNGAAFNFATTVDVASAATCNIGAASSNLVRITGTTGITSFGSISSGYPLRFLRFASALTITYNASTMILPGATDLAISADDCAIMVPLGGSSWMMAHYQSASGSSGGSDEFDYERYR